MSTERPTTEAYAEFFHGQYWSETGDVHRSREDAASSDCEICWKSADDFVERFEARSLPAEPTAPTPRDGMLMRTGWHYPRCWQGWASAWHPTDWECICARLAAEPDHEHRYVGADPSICQVCLAAEPDGEGT